MFEKIYEWANKLVVVALTMVGSGCAPFVFLRGHQASPGSKEGGGGLFVTIDRPLLSYFVTSQKEVRL